MEIEYQKSTIKLADVIGTSHISNKVKNHNKISLLFSNQLTKLKKRVSSNLDNNNSKDAKFKIKNKQTKESHNNNIIFRKIKNTTKTCSKNNFNNKTRNKINTQFCSNKTSILNEKDTINSSNINYTNDPLFGATNNLTSNVDNNILTISLQKHSYKNSKKFIDKQKNYSLINNTNKNNYKNKYAPNLSSNLDDDQFMNKNNKTIYNSNIFCLNINKQMKDKMYIENEYICKECGKKYKSTNVRTIFCSANCRSKNRRKSGIDNEIRICENCGKKFEINKYSKVQVCGRSCMMKLRWKNKK